MPRMLPKYPVTAEWRAEVRTRLAARKRGPNKLTQSAIAREAGISSATFSGLLAGRYTHSHAVPEINRLLGLPPPSIPQEATELLVLFSQLDDRDRERVIAFERSLAVTSTPNPGRKRT